MNRREALFATGALFASAGAVVAADDHSHHHPRRRPPVAGRARHRRHLHREGRDLPDPLHHAAGRRRQGHGRLRHQRARCRQPPRADHLAGAESKFAPRLPPCASMSARTARPNAEYAASPALRSAESRVRECAKALQDDDRLTLACPHPPQRLPGPRSRPSLPPEFKEAPDGARHAPHPPGRTSRP